MSTKLSVNIDHIATLRNARKGLHPDLVTAIKFVKSAGADGVTFHLREDRRHITDKDVKRIKEANLLPMNFEAAPSQEMIKIIKETKPQMVTFVPEKREELTTESGLDVVINKNQLIDIIKDLHQHEIKVALFVDPDEKHIEMSKEIGADFVEIHTGNFANSFNKPNGAQELMTLDNAISHAKKLDLAVNAGHGLNFDNVGKVVGIGGINEVSIGHFLISASVFMGLQEAVKKFKKIIQASAGVTIRKSTYP